MSLPDEMRQQLRDSLWSIADSVSWLSLGPIEKSQYYENWTKDSRIGGVLQRYMAVGKVRVYIKDSLLKGYSQARRADASKPFRMLGLQEDLGTTMTFTKPHGRMLEDGRIVCWGRAADWKTVLMAAFERSLTIEHAIPFAVVLSESTGKFSDLRSRAIVGEAARRLEIERLVWDT